MKRRAFALLVLLATGSLGVGPCAPESIGSLAPPADGGPTSSGGRDGITDAPQAPRGTDASAPGLTLPPRAALPPCAEHSDVRACLNTSGCRWLTPACGTAQPAFLRDGCFALAELDCKSDSACDAGKRCTPVAIDPCRSPSSGTPGPQGTISSSCPACAMPIAVCL